jgi:hypothetical protein
MRDEDNGLTKERDRRVQGGILIAMVIMVVVGVLGAFLQVLGFPGGHGSGAPAQQSVLEVEVPRADWSRFVEAADRFAGSRGLFMLRGPANLPVKQSAETVSIVYLGDKGMGMNVDIGRKGQFVVTFIDKDRNGAEQTLERAFRTDVVEAGGFRPLP